MRLAFASIFMALLIIGATQGALIQDIKPGKVNVDLGDGYKASFILPNAVSAYDIKTEPEYHSASVSASGSEDSFIEITLWVESQPFPHSIPAAGSGSGLTYVPRAIDKASGCVIYDYPEGNPGTNPDESDGAAFRYYPGATSLKAKPDGSTEVEGIYEVYADTLGSSGPTTISVFDSILNSIHVTGV